MTQSPPGGMFVLPETDFSAQSAVLVGLFKSKTQRTKLSSADGANACFIRHLLTL